ncbi:MAG: DUF1700 domain-containing protein [Clostridia bacterium]
MNKNDFLTALAARLSALSQDEIKRSLDYYSEMIEDRTEDGMDELEAVAALGTLDDIVKEIMLDISLPRLIKASIKPKHTLCAWQIVLIVLGSPVWLPLIFAFMAVIVAVYVAIWAVIISLFSGVAALCASGIVGIAAAAVIFPLKLSSGLLILGISMACVGIGILAFFGVKKLSVWLIKLTERFLKAVKGMFIKKEAK